MKIVRTLSNKIRFKLLDEDKQPKNTILDPNAELLKVCEVIDIGPQVTEVKVGDLITLFSQDIIRTGLQKDCFCTIHSVLFINEYTKQDRFLVSEKKNNDLGSMFKKVTVLKTHVGSDMNVGDDVLVKSNAGILLPDSSLMMNTSIAFCVVDLEK